MRQHAVHQTQQQCRSDAPSVLAPSQLMPPGHYRASDRRCRGTQHHSPADRANTCIQPTTRVAARPILPSTQRPGHLSGPPSTPAPEPQIPIAPVAPLVPNLPRLRALALLRRRPEPGRLDTVAGVRETCTELPVDTRWTICCSPIADLVLVVRPRSIGGCAPSPETKLIQPFGQG